MENYEYDEYYEYDWEEASYEIDYYCEAAEKVTKLGYSAEQVEMFLENVIMKYYYDGKTVDEAIDIEFPKQ